MTAFRALGDLSRKEHCGGGRSGYTVVQLLLQVSWLVQALMNLSITMPYSTIFIKIRFYRGDDMGQVGYKNEQ